MYVTQRLKGKAHVCFGEVHRRGGGSLLTGSPAEPSEKQASPQQRDDAPVNGRKDGPT